MGLTLVVGLQWAVVVSAALFFDRAWEKIHKLDRPRGREDGWVGTPYERDFACRRWASRFRPWSLPG